MSAFEHLLHECKDPVGAAVKLLLVWLAVADESLSRHERLLLAEAFDDTATGSGTFDQLRRIVEQGEVEDLLAASATVRDRLQPAAKEALLELAFRLANSDGGLSAAENHILQFLGDLLGVGPERFRELYRRTITSPFPDPPDPSSAQDWRRRAGRRAGERSGTRPPPRHDGQARRAEALATLGLGDGATPEEIKRAYRRLAQTHHPDRFAPLGEEAMKAANATFARIQQAYEYLVRG